MREVKVLEVDRDLASEMEPENRAVAERACISRMCSVDAGTWDTESGVGAGGPGWLGLLVLSGALCRRVGHAERYGCEVLGTGDVLRPWDRFGDWTNVPHGSQWKVIKRAEIAVLDQAFGRRAAAFPQVTTALISRALQRARHLAVLTAIVSQPRVETRLHMLFWHLADRFGRVRGNSIRIELPLTHSLLAELVAARRPSVTTALSKLSARRILSREDGEWILHGEVPEEYLDINVER